MEFFGPTLFSFHPMVLKIFNFKPMISLGRHLQCQTIQYQSTYFKSGPSKEYHIFGPVGLSGSYKELMDEKSSLKPLDLVS